MTPSADWTPLLDQVRPPGASNSARMIAGSGLGLVTGLIGGDLLLSRDLLVVVMAATFLVLVPPFLVLLLAVGSWSAYQMETFAAAVSAAAALTASGEFSQYLWRHDAALWAWLLSFTLVVLLIALETVVSTAIGRAGLGNAPLEFRLTGSRPR